MTKEDRRLSRPALKIRKFPAIYTVGAVYAPLPTASSTPQQARNTRPLSPTNSIEWTKNLTHLVAEVVCGRRAISALRRWTRPPAFNAIQAFVSNYNGPHLRLLRTKISMIHPKAAEISLILDNGRRASAIAMRVQAMRNKWMVTEFVAIQ